MVGGRYRVTRELGRGGMAVVLEGEDTWLGNRPVALKLGRADVPRARERLARELGLVGGIKHPHLMRVFGSVELIDAPPDVTSLALVLELYAFANALEWAKGRSPQQIAGIGARIAAGLAALHVLGVRHGDVSPLNLRVASESDCKLIDFGLAERGVGQVTAGTLRVMAPEALAGRPSPASDIYALAATLADMLAPHVQRAPGSAITDKSALGEALEAMSHADEARRADAATAAELLARVAGDATSAAIIALRDGPPAVERAVGREAELARLVPAPNGRVVRHVISGARGSGKTTLLRACAAAALEAGYRVAGGVHNGASGDLDSVMAALRELRIEVGVTTHEDDPAAARYARDTAIAEALARATEPLALIIDDVPPGSPLHELGEFLERFEDAKLLWLQVGDGGAPLAPLSAEAVRELLRVARPMRAVDLEASAALYHAGAGHPRTTMALLAAYPGPALLEAASRGKLEPPSGDDLDDDRRGLLAAISLFAGGAPLALLRQQVVPGLIDALIDRGLVVLRITDDVTVLESTRRVPLEHLPQELAIKLEKVLDEQRYPIERALLALRRGDTAKAEELVLAGGTRAERGGQLARALEAYEAVDAAAPSSALAVAVARALSSLGRPADALARLRSAGEHAERRALEADALVSLGRYADAAALLAEPARPGEPAAKLDALKVRALMLAGRYAEARDASEALLAAQPKHARRADLLNVAGVCHFYLGDAATARSLLGEAVSSASDGRSAEASRANLALVLHKSGELRAAEESYAQCIADLEARRDLPRKLLRLTNLAILRQELGSFGQALTSYADAAELARLTANDRAAARVLLNQANLLAWLGVDTEARAACDEAATLCERTGLTVERAYLRLIAAELAVNDNAFADAERGLAEARASFGATGDRAGTAEADVVAALLGGKRGQHDAAAAAANEAAKVAQSLKRQRLELRARVVAGIVAVAPIPDARRRELAERCGDPDLAWMAFALEGRAEHSLGQVARAQEHFAAARRQLAAVRAALPAHYEKAYSASWWRAELLRPLSSALPEDTVMNRDVERLLAINRELARDHDPERLLERIIDAAIALSGAERGFLLLTGDETELEVRTARGLEARHLAPDELQISRSIARQVIDSNAPLSAIDAQQDQRFRDYQSVHSLKLRSVLCLPLRAGSTPLGAIYLDHRYRASAFTETDVALLAAFGDQAAIAIANARLLAELTRRASELETSRAAIDELNQRLERELAAREAELAATKPTSRDEPSARHGMVGRSAAMRDIFRVIDRVADKEVPVAITGESGTGKELVARALHVASSRRGPFVPVNCGAIPEALLESELFGHERGAFTGAVRAKPGLFEIARGGTIFLDEIGDMPLGMQVKLLRVLQAREFRRVGGTIDLQTDARVVSATNRNLEELVRAGKFREDLWYRLNVVEMHLPALRERRDDLPLLIDHLLTIHARGLEVKLSKRALAALLDYDWPGNVRELDNELQRAIALADGTIEPDVLSGKVSGQAMPATPGEEPADGTLKMILDRHERDVIRATLAEHGGRVAAAARALGLTRAGLYKKMHKLGVAAADRD